MLSLRESAGWSYYERNPGHAGSRYDADVIREFMPRSPVVVRLSPFDQRLHAWLEAERRRPEWCE